MSQITEGQGGGDVQFPTSPVSGQSVAHVPQGVHQSAHTREVDELIEQDSDVQQAMRDAAEIGEAIRNLTQAVTHRNEEVSQISDNFRGAAIHKCNNARISAQTTLDEATQIATYLSERYNAPVASYTENIQRTYQDIQERAERIRNMAMQPIVNESSLQLEVQGMRNSENTLKTALQGIKDFRANYDQQQNLGFGIHTT